jgi:hypothetical protein
MGVLAEATCTTPLHALLLFSVPASAIAYHRTRQRNERAIVAGTKKKHWIFEQFSIVKLCHLAGYCKKNNCNFFT